MSESLRLEWVHPADLTSNPRNWRRHPDLQRDALDALLYGEDAVGWAGAALYNEATGRLIDGHLRREVAAVRDEPIPVLVGSWTEEQEAKILATLDPLAAMAEADREKLGALLQDVQTGEAAVSEMLAGLAEREGVLFGNGHEPPDDPGPQVDRAAELQEKWGVKTGDLWVIPSKTADGEHRVICGDCTEAAVVERVMGGGLAQGMITDPPYGVDKAEWDASFPDNSTWDLFKQFLMDGANIVIFPGEANAPPKLKILFDVFDYQWPVIWYKPNAMQFGKTGYTVQNIAWWLSIGNPQKKPKFRDVIVDSIVPKNNDFGHPSPKNLGVICELVGQFIEMGFICVDPFLGSGTTLVACERLGRLGRGVEIEPKYVAVTLERLAGMGLEPRRVE